MFGAFRFAAGLFSGLLDFIRRLPTGTGGAGMIDWSIPYTLTTPAGTLELNTPTTINYGTGTGYLFLLDPDKCKAGPGPLRIAIDPIPQADGSIIHTSFLNGFLVHLGVRLWVQNGDSVEARSPACDTDLRQMWDELILHCNALKSPSVLELFGAQCRMVYTPAGYFENRMVDGIQLVEWPEAQNPVPEVTAEFSLQSVFPYEEDEAEAGGGDVVIGPGFLPYNNSGNTETYPVFTVTAVGAPLTQFTIENQTLGQSIVYDADLPGAPAIAPGDFVEINCFRNTVYLNAVSANLKSGIDVMASDFFPLVPQPDTNMLKFTPTGGSAICTMNYNYAWAN